MRPAPLKPRKALNKAYLKVKPGREQINTFKVNLGSLLNQVSPDESEEFNKNLLSRFLRDTYYHPDYFINTKGRNDLVIHNGKDARSGVGVIIEAKKPGNKTEMLSTENLNTKALQELLWYFLGERITGKNDEVKHLIATNVTEWFIFDAQLFDKLFAQDKALVKRFESFRDKQLSSTSTDYFYREIAAPAIEANLDQLTYTHFRMEDYERPLNKEGEEGKLIPLYKILSPEHLLKLPFVNDSNTLDKRFYSELLHIIGLSETKQGGKKLIERKKKGQRDNGSLLENTINQLDSLDKINRMEDAGKFGENYQDRLFNVGLELCITWINRILFLKLLEAQVVRYHKNDKNYSFLNIQQVPRFGDLNALFFSVLARKPEERNEYVREAFTHVPYLNSSLFEVSEIEDKTIVVSNLLNERTIPLHPHTVLKDRAGNRIKGDINTLEYLFAFLNAYDFASEGTEDIQEENKTLINASVLGLIFEKINGYKDGSFFTPGFITMYMCRETIRRAVLQKFKEAKGWECDDLASLYNKIDDTEEANGIVNDLKICDPAVGSGHFLVSALNEIIAIKHELKILRDRQGKRLKEYNIEVVNDELVITDEDGELFEYRPGNNESQRVQEALFNEKQIIIEGCLFGVDINPNSVKICRLRLWIELLKHAYYKDDGQLETLPNIDINIKCGNSLVSRFSLDADLSQALKTSKWDIETYQTAVQAYRHAHEKEEKREMIRLISDIKNDFRTEISANDPKVVRLTRLKGELFNLTNQTQLFDRSKKEQAAWDKKMNKLTKDITKLEKEIKEIKNNRIYDNAFEWRFEFPEVLNDDGDFVGFDVVIGNPPYIRQEEFSGIKPYLKAQFDTFAGTADLYVYFVELSMRLLRKEGDFTFIIPNKWMRAGYGKNLRYFLQKHYIEQILDFGDLPVFEEATTYPCIIQLRKTLPTKHFTVANIHTLNFPEGMPAYISENKISTLTGELQPEGWTLADSKVQKLLAKIRSKGIPLGEYVKGKIFRGVLTGLNEAFVVDQNTRDRLIKEDPKSAEIIKPFLAGRDIKRYQQPVSDKYLILLKYGDTKKWFGELSEMDALDRMLRTFPSIMQHLMQFEVKVKARYDQGQYWWELRFCDYYEEFEKEKIIIPAIVKSASYGYDKHNYIGNDKTTIIPTTDVYLFGMLNSSLIDFYLRNIASTKQNGYFEYKPVYLAQLPIYNATEAKKQEIETATKEVMQNKSRASIDTTFDEQEIDQLVYELYELTEEEIKTIEDCIKP